VPPIVLKSSSAGVLTMQLVDLSVATTSTQLRNAQSSRGSGQWRHTFERLSVTKRRRVSTTGSLTCMTGHARKTSVTPLNTKLPPNEHRCAADNDRTAAQQDRQRAAEDQWEQ